MNRFETGYYQPTFLKQHEDRIQKLRHERKSENQRLDILRKALETRLSASSPGRPQGRAA
jgi:hypothetical protein